MGVVRMKMDRQVLGSSASVGNCQGHWQVSGESVGVWGCRQVDSVDRCRGSSAGVDRCQKSWAGGRHIGLMLQMLLDFFCLSSS